MKKVWCATRIFICSITFCIQNFIGVGLEHGGVVDSADNGVKAIVDLGSMTVVEVFDESKATYCATEDCDVLIGYDGKGDTRSIFCSRCMRRNRNAAANECTRRKRHVGK